MVTLKFNFKINSHVKSRSSSISYTVIESKCEGVITIQDDGEYKVKYNNKLYKITEASYETKGKRIIYAKQLDKYGHRIKIIRDSDSRSRLDKRFYFPFAVGLIAKGRIVKYPFTGEQFHIVSCYSAGDTEGAIEAFREWKEYEDNLNNKTDE